MRRDDIGIQDREPLRMDDVEAATDHERRRQDEAEDGGERRKPGGGNVVRDDSCRKPFESIGEHVHVVTGRETLGELGNVAAVPEHAVVVVNDERDPESARHPFTPQVSLWRA